MGLRGSTTLPPPCQAVTLIHSAFLAAFGGSSLTVPATSRFGAGFTSCSEKVALVGGPAPIWSANTNRPITATAATGTGLRGSSVRSYSGAPSDPPTKPPIAPPARAAMNPAMMPSGTRALVHGIVHQMWDHAH